MRLSNDLQFNPHPVSGGNPEVFWGTTEPDTGSTFTTKELGSLYHLIRQSGTGYGVTELWQKVADNDLASDWACVAGTLKQKITRADFTDGGSTAGTLVLTADLPAGAFVLGSSVRDVTGFIGDTSAVLAIGDGTDADRYNTSTFNVFTTAAIPASVLTQNAPSGNRGHTAAMATITITVTSAADFTNVSAGQATITISYLIP